MTTKPKPWRGRYLTDRKYEATIVYRDSVALSKVRPSTRCTVIPDGYPIPQSPRVRRVMRKLGIYFSKPSNEATNERIALWAAWQLYLKAHQRAERRKVRK